MDDQKMNQLRNALLEQLPAGVILTDDHGDIVMINSAAEKIRRIDREQLLGRNVLFCHRESSRPNVERAIAHIFKKPETVYRRMVDDSKNSKYYINTYAGVQNDQHEAIGMVILTEDITDKRKSELERAEAYQMMQENADTLKNKYHQLLMASMESIALILEKRDPYTCNHSSNVCQYALKMYEHRYGVGNDYYTLRTAAMLHDIGKIGISDEILHKPGRLTPEEFRLIQCHSVIAEEVLRPLDAGSNLSQIVRHHHECYDGSGYPDGLKGTEIPDGSRIISIADAFDAMHTNRPYRQALPLERCLEEIKDYSGRQFDPEWTEVFLDLADTGSL